MEEGEGNGPSISFMLKSLENPFSLSYVRLRSRRENSPGS